MTGDRTTAPCPGGGRPPTWCGPGILLCSSCGYAAGVDAYGLVKPHHAYATSASSSSTGGSLPLPPSSLT